MDRINVGLIGFGTVGTGLVRILQEHGKLLEQRLGVPMVLKRIADQDVTRDRGIKVNPALLTTKVSEVLDDPEIAIVVELIGGLEPARTFLLQAIERGKHVVTANDPPRSSRRGDIQGRGRSRGGHRFRRQCRGRNTQSSVP